MCWWISRPYPLKIWSNQLKFLTLKVSANLFLNYAQINWMRPLKTLIYLSVILWMNNYRFFKYIFSVVSKYERRQPPTQAFPVFISMKNGNETANEIGFNEKKTHGSVLKEMSLIFTTYTIDTNLNLKFSICSTYFLSPQL